MSPGSRRRDDIRRTCIEGSPSFSGATERRPENLYQEMLRPGPSMTRRLQMILRLSQPPICSTATTSAKTARMIVSAVS